MARTRWPPDLATPASRTGQADQTGHAGGCQKNLGPADRSIPRTARSASADSEVRPGPRPPTLRPTNPKPRKQGRSTIHILPAEYERHVTPGFAWGQASQNGQFGALRIRQGTRAAWPSEDVKIESSFVSKVKFEHGSLGWGEAPV